MKTREERVLCHFEDADGHVVIPCQLQTQRPDSEFWGETGRGVFWARPTRYGPCRVGLTMRIRRMRPPEAWRVQRDEIAHEVPCLFEGDEEGPYGPCETCGRRPPAGCAWAAGYEA